MNEYPLIDRVGLAGVIVTFDDGLSERANLAAITFRAAVDAEGWSEVTETASTLVSTFLAVDLAEVAYDEMRDRLAKLLATRDWYAAELPAGRRLWTIPMCFDPEVAPQMGEVAEAAGVSEDEARRDLAASRTRIITLGYLPGQPYMGLLPKRWDIPRQSNLTPRLPAGALVIAIRQFVLFTAAMPTGWRHVGQTAFRPFDLNRDVPIAFAPGDEVRFDPISVATLKKLESTDSLGGATAEPIS